ncbi:GntR family transcriptional regulator [Streptococcus iniae]|uniref:GntR family transcriptional regulator n=1 Tax=Streptococcus iniae TaxID=1346 RepID=A0A3L8GNZ9_STRIN|nr:GntR family transcriptional regulator [Streptococcus iniae]AGM97862.1 GntR family transcriptional regulator [Streptococcus iniae SF1]AHY14952.1 GntR family transcriptional regulator [Streptococcus iniae]AHY16824.1 GntR family transcriptional regulator [Streptococcus iniae]AJG25109.1 GntR family transcriptional regulator [Streptococcus iniae]APD31010.1 GntR family transcriptional regulator [Streptococcus iniae]
MTNQQPLYMQMVDVLEVKIRETMSPNDKLLSERELSETYGVSRITVRLALKELEIRGLIYKKQGKGTYVSAIKEPATDLSSAYSFTEEMKKQGRQPQTKILSFQKMAVTPYLSGLLGLEVGVEVIEIERLRLADGMALMLERTFLPSEVFTSLTEEMVSQKPLYDIFSEDYQQVVRFAEEEFYASIALDYEASLLDIKKGDPVLHLVRKTNNDRNLMIEYTFSIARADKFRYRITHQPTHMKS